MVQEPSPPVTDLKKLVHELRVHQVELEAQTVELRSANEQLEASQGRYRQLYEMAPVGYCTTSTKGSVTDANEMATGLLGAPVDAIVGRQLTDFILPADQDAFYLHDQKLKRAGDAHGSKLRMMHQGQGPFWARLEARMIEDGSGQLRCHTAIIDITKQLEYEEHFRYFSHHPMAAREDERRALSHALHHDLGSLAVGVGSLLAVSSKELSDGQTEAAMVAIEGSKKALRQSVTTLKQLALDLRPPELEELGLAEVLRQHTEQVRTRTGIDLEFSDSTGSQWLAPTVAIVLYRICQEALNNAIRHAKAGKILVSLALSRGSVEARVSDNGIGFDMASLRTAPGISMGLISIAEMVSSVNGSLKLDSQLGKGTQISVAVPHVEEGP
jgi:PAS domain S-box-containing protein